MNAFNSVLCMVLALAFFAASAIAEVLCEIADAGKNTAATKEAITEARG